MACNDMPTKDDTLMWYMVWAPQTTPKPFDGLSQSLLFITIDTDYRAKYGSVNFSYNTRDCNNSVLVDFVPDSSMEPTDATDQSVASTEVQKATVKRSWQFYTIIIQRHVMGQCAMLTYTRCMCDYLMIIQYERLVYYRYASTASTSMQVWATPWGW